MASIHMRLDSSFFTAWRQPDGRIGLQINTDEDTVTLDMDPDVVVDLMLELIDPNPED